MNYLNNSNRRLKIKFVDELEIQEFYKMESLNILFT